jgi:hypothetical protein
MLKSAMIATISIAALLPISSIASASARSIDRTSIHHSISKPQASLIAKQSNSAANTVPKADILKIRNAIAQYYQKVNTIALPKYGLGGGSSKFISIKSLNMISFNSTNSIVDAEEIEQHYDFTSTKTDPAQLAWRKSKDSSEYRDYKKITKIHIAKEQGKWIVKNALPIKQE